MFENLTVLQMLWIGAAIFSAYVIRGMSGFGAGLIAAPMLAFVLPVHVVVPVTGLLVFVLFIFLTIRDRREVIWRELKLLAPPTVAPVRQPGHFLRSLSQTTCSIVDAWKLGLL